MTSVKGQDSVFKGDNLFPLRNKFLARKKLQNVGFSVEIMCKECQEFIQMYSLTGKYFEYSTCLIF